MEHFYKDIYGFADYLGIYRKAVKMFPSGSHFVEVGSFLGKSAVFMAVEIINSGKNIKFDCVDHWLGSDEHRSSPSNEPNSLDFIFIDASHDEISVKQDLAYWMPRLKENGMIAGDDVDSEGVANALNWFFDTEKLDIVGRQWMLNLSKEGEEA